MFGESYTEPASVLTNAIRSVFAFFDRPAYWLLSMSYMLFFNVASADIFNNETIMKFYGRVQVILGVFMMFQLAMTILKGIVNPDSFTGDKGSGRAIITKIMTSLLLLTILMPIPIPNPSTEYEKRINNNGLLFGTLYSLQHRILSNNTIGRLVLGTSSTDTSFMSGNDDDNSLDQSTRIFTSTIIKSFYRINLIPEEDRDKSYVMKGEDPAIYNENRVCTDIDDAILDTYTAIDANPFDIISMVNATCDSDAQPGFLNNLHTTFQTLTGSTKYVFSYMGIVSFIVPLVFAIILFSFTIDIAVRAIKLAVLRLLAPIPIIRYMDPNGGKDSAFNAWVKALTSTYLDLFIRLATVYFVIFIIQDMIINGISINDSYGWLLNVFTYIAIWIGLFVFAKQAPKFIKQILGMKEDSGKFFDGLTSALGVGAVGAGVVSGSVSKAAATHQNGGNLAKSIASGITGAIGGGYNAGKSFFTTKDATGKSVMGQVRSYNARNYSNAEDESTPFGRFKAGIQGGLGLKNQMQKLDDKIKLYNAAQDAMGRISKSFDGNGDYKFNYSGADIKDRDGNVIVANGSQQSLKSLNDFLNFYSSDGIASKALDDAKKAAQGKRFAEIRGLSRAQVQANIDNGVAGWSTSDLNVYDAAKTMYDVARKYSDEPEFSHLSGISFDYTDPTNPGSEWGKIWKHDAAAAGKSADQIKNSDEYARAKANAHRADEKSKK